MIIYKNVDYGINAYRISLFKLKFECVGEIIWRPFDLVPSEPFGNFQISCCGRVSRTRNWAKTKNKFIKQFSKHKRLNENYSYVLVQPQSFRDEDEIEKVLEVENLYEIYEKLGFYFTEENIDRTKPLHIMQYDLQLNFLLPQRPEYSY